MDKQKLEELLTNGEVCGNCHACGYCGETGQDCYALRLLHEITGYPSFDKSRLSCEYTACEQNSKTQHCDALKRWQDKQALSSKNEIKEGRVNE